jgi:hypothetical protein
MRSSRVLSVSVLAFAILVAQGARLASAAAVDSDRLLITDTAGVVIFDNSIPEAAAGALEPTLTFAGGPAPVPPPIPLASAITIPGINILLLTEPAGEPIDPTEPPILLPNGGILSDVLISTVGVNPAVAPPFITLISDGSPEFQQIAGLLPTLTGANILTETGQLQDVTSLLVGPQTNPFGPIRVQVQSDVTPEPGVLLLLGSGLGLLAIARTRRARA